MPSPHCHFAVERHAQRRRAHALAAHLAGDRFLAAIDHLRDLLAKAGFNPDQPRVPPGNPDGGRWRYVEGYAQGEKPWDGSNGGPPLDAPPNVPKERPENRPSRTAKAKEVAKWLASFGLRRIPQVAAVLAAIEAAQWLRAELPSIRSYGDPPRSMEELIERARETRPGYDRHHIVEQKSAGDDGFPRSMIDGLENVVSIPRYKHREISAWYATKTREFGGLSPREYLRGKSWGERRNVGLKALRDKGVLKP